MAQDPPRGSGHQELFKNSRVGSGGAGSGWVGSGRVGSGRVGCVAWGRVGSDRVRSVFEISRVGLGWVGPGGSRTSWARSGDSDPDRLAIRQLIRE